MLVAGRREMNNICILNTNPFTLQLLQGCRHIDRIPDDNRVRHQIETTGLIGLFVGLVSPQLALVGKKDEPS